MIVAERGAHLAGGEVEDAPAAVVEEVRALRPLDEERREIADVADHVALDRILQLPPPFPPVLRAAGCLIVHRRGLLPCGHPMPARRVSSPGGRRDRESRPRPRRTDARRPDRSSGRGPCSLGRATKAVRKPSAPRGLEVGVVGGDHHAPIRREAEQIGGAKIGGGQRLVRAGDLGAEDRVPRQPRAPGHVDQERHVAVGQGGQDEAPLQPGQALDRVRPRLEPVPGAVQMLDLGVLQSGEAELIEHDRKVLAMQVIEPDPRAAAAAHLLHRGLIERAPAIGDGLPVALDAARAKEAAQLASDAAAPVDHRAEHVKRERGDLVEGHGLVSRSGRSSAVTVGCRPAASVASRRTLRNRRWPPRDRATSPRAEAGWLDRPQVPAHRLSPARQPAGGGTSRWR